MMNINIHVNAFKNIYVSRFEFVYEKDNICTFKNKKEKVKYTSQNTEIHFHASRL